MRPIDADALIEDFENSGWQNLSWVAKHHWSHAVQLKDLLVKIIGQSPTISSEDLRPKGRWIYLGESLFDTVYKCSECGHPEKMNKKCKKKYCPSCGAKMEE